MSKAILMISSLVLSGAFSHDAKSAQKVQTTDLGIDESKGTNCGGFWDHCGGGLSCSTITKKCVEFGKSLEACGDSNGGISCIDNYWCDLGIGSGYTCSSGAQGEACSKLNWPHTCNSGLSCISSGICSVNAGPKAACGSSAGGVDCVGGYWCSAGIGNGDTCSSGKEGEACASVASGGETCNDGLSCISRGYCAKNAGPGDLCGKSAGNVDCGADYYCTEGLAKGKTCSSGREGEACSKLGESCNDGLSCISTDSIISGRCAKNAGPGEPCGMSANNGGLLQTTDCGSGYWCTPGPKGSNGWTCSKGSNGEACGDGTFSASCSSGFSCLTTGYCGPNAGPGELCGSDAKNVDCLGWKSYCTEGLPKGMTCSTGKIGQACGGGSGLFRIRECGGGKCTNGICVA